ncbi:MAG: bifunctional UDP-N-acetylglucosamine diphosphorylase/glucosamine-1-phosphate N-acetyltransferase GlmU [Wenzhouxiangella sp.]
MLEILILAAGEGKRMNSSRPKVLQPIAGRPMLLHLIAAVDALTPDRVRIVIGFGAGQVEAALPGFAGNFVIQAERLGTGHAAQQALPDMDPEARVLILPGDMPLIRPRTLKALLDSTADLAVLSFVAEDPTGYGRILRDPQGRVLAVREQRDASETERAVREVNSGVMCARAGRWVSWLDQVRPNNAQGEYYLTDCIALAVAEGCPVDAVVAEDAEELLGANDRGQLAALEQVYQRRARAALLDSGVTLPDPDSVQIRGRVVCERDVMIDRGVILEGDVELGEGVIVGPGCIVRDSNLAAGTKLEPYCVLEGVQTLGACSIGPFARLRPGTELAEGVKIGNFVEVKKARFEQGAKASHLSYIGDARVGQGANIGAGTITCNYDGVNKHVTEIGAEAFIGSNTALVAPIKVGERATIGAGSVISKDAPADQLSLTRSAQRSIAGWQRPKSKT